MAREPAPLPSAWLRFVQADWMVWSLLKLQNRHHRTTAGTLDSSKEGMVHSTNSRAMSVHVRWRKLLEKSSTLARHSSCSVRHWRNRSTRLCTEGGPSSRRPESAAG